MKPRNENFKTLRKLMIDADLTQRLLSERCGVSDRFIRFLLRGERRSKKVEPCVARELGISQKRLAKLIKRPA